MTFGNGSMKTTSNTARRSPSGCGQRQPSAASLLFAVSHTAYTSRRCSLHLMAFGRNAAHTRV